MSESEYMGHVTAGAASKNEKIRILDAAGYTRSQIAKFLGLSYQRVDNTLRQKRPGAWTAPDLPPRPGTVAAEPDAPPYARIVVEPDGRIVVPAWLSRVLELPPGSTVPHRVADGEIHLLGRSAGLRYAQDLVAELCARDGSVWSEELIASRRAEAGRE